MVLAAEDEGYRLRGWGVDDPGQHCLWRTEGNGAVIKPPCSAHNTAAVTHRVQQGGKDAHSLEHPAAMDGHTLRLRRLRVATGGDKAQIGNGEIGAKAGDTAHIQWTGGFHQHNAQRNISPHSGALMLCR